METLEIEDLKILLASVYSSLDDDVRGNKYFKQFKNPVESLMKTSIIIEQMIKDIVFEQSQKPLPY